MRKTLLAVTIAATLAGASQAQAADLWDIYQQALANDPTFLQADANYQAAIEARPIARAGYLPSISLTGKRTITRSSGPESQFSGTSFENFQLSAHDYNTTYSAQLTQPIFDWAAWNTIEQADATAAQAEATYVAAQQSLIVRTATAYFNVLNARDTLAADHAATEANAKQLEQAKEKYDVGMSAITDVENAQAAYDQSVATEIGAQQQVTNQEESLRAITGQPVGELLEPSPEMPLRSPDPASAQQWVDQALKQNPNLLAAQSGADAASAGVGIKRAGYMPTLDLVLSHTKNTDNQSGTLTGPAPSTAANPFASPSDITGNTALLQLSWPIFSGGGTWASVSQAQHQYDAALDNAKLVNRQTEQQARTAYLGVLTGISQVTALKQSVKSNQTSMDATETGLQVGTRTIVDVLTARQNLLTAETGFSNARYTYLESVLQLKQAAGSLSEADLKQINTVLQVKAPMASPTAADTAASTPAPAMGSTTPAVAAPAAGTTTPPAGSPPKAR